MLSSPSPPAGGDVRDHTAQTRILIVLAAAQVVGSLGIGASVSVGALLAEDLSGSEAWSGMAATLTTLGAALWALPLARAAERRGRRIALTSGWAVATIGAIVTVLAAMLGSFALLLAALLLMGAGNAANLQSRFAATDLAHPTRRARSLALVVWSTTIGAVIGPNLTRPGAALAQSLGIPSLSGPFVFSAVAAAGAGTILGLALKPDPLQVARTLTTGLAPRSASEPGAATFTANALTVIRRTPQARSALIVVVTSHTVMVAVMAMTPVHMHGHGASLSLIGLTISLHIAGMFALSPVSGWLADRAGRTPAILTGQALLITATIITATAGDSSAHITAGLILLGLGWSCSIVAASTQLAESVSDQQRPRVQGTADLLMNLGAAAAAALAGITVAGIGFSGLSLLAALAVLPAAITVLMTTA